MYVRLYSRDDRGRDGGNSIDMCVSGGEESRRKGWCEMTREEILAMKPGRELDALVAEKVMGWTNFSPIDPDCDYGVGVNGYRRNYAKSPDGQEKPFPFYSTDMSATWEVFEKIKEEGAWVEVAWNPKKKHYRCLIGAEPIEGLQTVDLSGTNTAAEAICKAALLAVMEL